MVHALVHLSNRREANITISDSWQSYLTYSIWPMSRRPLWSVSSGSMGSSELRLSKSCLSVSSQELSLRLKWSQNPPPRPPFHPLLPPYYLSWGMRVKSIWDGWPCVTQTDRQTDLVRGVGRQRRVPTDITQSSNNRFCVAVSLFFSIAAPHFGLQAISLLAFHWVHSATCFPPLSPSFLDQFLYPSLESACWLWAVRHP